jgi:hypothetical protein
MALPEAILQFISSDESLQKRIDLMRRFSVPFEVNIKFTQTINRLYDKEIELSELIPELKKTTNLSDDALKQIVLELAGYEFLPVSDYLGDVVGLIKSLGGDPEKYPATRITIREVTPVDVVSEVLHENTVNVPAHLDMRLRETLESFVRSVRTKDDTVHRLTRAEKIGGVGLSEDDAEKIVNTLAEKASDVKINFSGSAPSPVASPEARPPEAEAMPQAAPSPIPKTTAVAIAAVAAPLPAPRREINISETAIDFEKQLAAASVRVAGGAGVPVPKELNDRFMNIIVARLKEVRKAGETAEALKKPVAAGGMGFGDEAAQKTLDLLETELSRIKASASTALNNEKEAFTKRSGEETVKRESDRRAEDTNELDRLYGKLSGQRSAAPKITPQLSPLKAAASAMASAAPAVPPAPIAPPSAPQSKMRDVRGAARPRLMGPGEELKNMNLTVFRRLSADPAVACQKLNDRLLILEEQSYSERVDGVKAWQDSPLNKLYLSILNESFGGGGGVSAVIRGREGKGEETLTEAEVRAIMDFNRKLKS